MQPVQASLQTAFETLSTAELGILDHLPAELMSTVLRKLDIRSFFRFRQVNRRARVLSTELWEYKLVSKHGLEGLRGVLRAELSHCFTIDDLYRALITDKCSTFESDCYFRILTNRHVKYITIKAGALDAESLDDMPLDFQNILPPLPYEANTWKTAYITRNPSSRQLEATFSSADLPSVKTIWHPRMIDYLDIERTEYLTVRAQECKLKADPALRMIAKMARFHWEVQYMEAKTRMYQVLDGRGTAPKFLGHIYEADRVIGFLLEKVPDGRNAEPADLEICHAALRRFHALGFLHGDCNKYNFIIRPDGQVVLIDFEKSEPCADPALLEAEIASLKGKLADTTGRGGGLLSRALRDSDGELEG
ncbi:hypothetical protein VP1G_04950 [Cytospora mali]|uniref:F-box domain-containing protein n=1 Tax=Cytospora mali TaxID=578113 RepID=A0A194V171_CYTMA|nr:hypothetical protein VP1G_04950 [Valsa mali var. pyri (nom. inval.)]